MALRRWATCCSGWFFLAVYLGTEPVQRFGSRCLEQKGEGSGGEREKEKEGRKKKIKLFAERSLLASHADPALYRLHPFSCNTRQIDITTGGLFRICV